MNQPLHILHLEDSREDVELVRRTLESHGIPCDVTVVSTKQDFVDTLKWGVFDIIFADYAVPSYDGDAALKHVRTNHPDIPFILVSETIGEDQAIKSLLNGATDYVLTGNLRRLVPAVRRALHEAEIRREHLKVEQALKETERRLNEAQEVGHIGSWEVDMRSGEIFWSNQALSILGCEGANSLLTFDGMLERCHPNDRMAVKCVPEKAKSSGSAVELEHRIVHKDGTVKWVNARVEPVFEGNKLVYLRGTIQDITRRKSAELKLTENEEFFRLLFTTSPDAILLYDPHSTDVPWKIIDCNDSTCRMNGYAREELIGKSIDTINTRATTDEERAAHIAMLRRNRVGYFETFHRHSDGHIFPIEVASTIVTLGGRELVLGIDRDVTQRRKTEMDLRTREAQLASAVKMAKLGHWEYDVARDRFIFNDLFYAMLHTTAEKVGGYELSSGEYARQFVHPEDLAMVGAEIGKALETKEPNYTSRIQHRIIYGDGGIGHITVQIHVVKDKEGRTVRTYGVNQDVTDRVQSEEALRYERSLLTGLMDHIPDHIYFKDLKSRFLKISKSQANRFGLENPAQAVGKTDFDFFAEDHARPAFEDEQNIIKTGEALVGIEEREVWPDGTVNWVSTTKAPLKDTSGQIIGTLGMSRDITARKNAEEGLKRQAAAIETAHEGIALLDSNGLYVFVNRAHASLYGFDDPEDLLGKSWEILYDRTQLKRFRETIMPVLDRIGSWYGEAVGRRRNGVIFPQDLSLTKLDDGGLVCVVRDMTERKRSEDALRLQSSALEAAANSIVITNKEGIIQWVNPAFTKITGYRDEEVIGKKTSILSSGKHDKEFYRRMWSAILGGQVWRGELTNKRKDGSLYDEEMTITPVLDDDGTIKEFVAIQQDITDRKKSQDVLRRYELLSENARDIIWFVRADSGRILEANKAAEAAYGYTRDELLSLKIYDIRDPSTHSTLQSQMDEADSTGIFIETVHRRKDGTTFPVEVSSHGAMIGDTRVLMSIIRDISWRKMAEEQMRLLVHAVKSITECVSITDLENKMLFVNDAMLKTYGYKREELLGKHISVLRADSEDIRTTAEIVSATLSGGWQGELSNKRKDGTVFPLWLSTSVVKDEIGNPVALVGVSSDISQRKVAEKQQKSLEDQLGQAQRMEAIGTLAGGIAHDFNNILGIILGHTTLIQRSKGDSALLATSIDTITKAVQRGASIVRQILAFARKSDLEHETVDVNTSVEDLTKMLRETLPKTIDIVVEKRSSFPVVNVDQSQLGQALMNLCINARDAMVDAPGKEFSKGKLLIRVDKVSGKKVQDMFADATASSYVSITVSDTGPGIPEEMKKRIFEPFFTTKPIGKGTGLGLSVVYGVMKGHNGFVDVQSEAGKGTTFTLYFPSAASYKAEERSTSPVPTRSLEGKETIFVVEDEESMALVLVKLLSGAGYTVITAKDGVEALETFEKNAGRIDVVVSDIGLPKMDGRELFASMKRKNPKVKVILASGYLDAGSKSEMLKAGAKDFVQKPYDALEVLNKIRDVLDAQI